jgi:hypothetical protein
MEKAARSNGYSLFPFGGCDGRNDTGMYVIGASGGARWGWEQLSYKWLSRRFSVFANRAER